MHWKNIKDKVLIFGEDDYVFADMFVSIINEYDKIVTNDDLRRYTFKMLEELMDENLIKVYLLNDNAKDLQINLYDYSNKQNKMDLISLLDKKWRQINYRLPQPNELFWITADLL